MPVAIALLFGVTVYFLLQFFKPELFRDADSSLPDSYFEDKARQEAQGEALLRGETRSWVPLSTRFKDAEAKIPFSLSGLKRKLLKAGSPMGVLEFLAFKVVAIVGLAVIGGAFAGNSPREGIILAGALVGFVLPEMWLNGKIKKRQASIRRDLPNIIDLLNLCVSGGLDFMLAVNRVVRDLKPCELTRELAEVYRETQMGKSRRDSLKNFAWRIDMPETYSFVRTLVQADRMGTPMSEALNVQAEEMRVRRFQNGESMALKAPIKLLFPLFVFILPVVLIIVGAPIIIQFTRGGVNFGF
jgi:tight adherence protein C